MMQTISANSNDFLKHTQTAIKRNTAIEVIDAKQTGVPIDKVAIQESNQEIKDKAVQVGASVYQANIQKQSIDTYTQATQAAKDMYATDSSESTSTEINSFDAQAVNEARSTVHKRAIGISVYEQVQSNKVD
jgi:hypothetical protein